MESRGVLWHSSKGLTRLGSILTEHGNMCWAAGHIVRLWATEGRYLLLKKSLQFNGKDVCSSEGGWK